MQSGIHEREIVSLLWVYIQWPGGVSVGADRLRKNWGSHIDASHSRQPLVKGERLVRHEVNAVMTSQVTGTRSFASDLLACIAFCILTAEGNNDCTPLRSSIVVTVTPKGMLLPTKCHASATCEGLRASSREHFPNQKYM